MSSAPPALVPQVGMYHLVPALGVCVFVGSLVFAWALIATRMGVSTPARYGGGGLNLPQQSRPLPQHADARELATPAVVACVQDPDSEVYACAPR